MIIICMVIVYPHLLRGNRFHHGPGYRKFREAAVLSGKLYLNGYKATLGYTPLWTAFKKYNYIYRCGHHCFAVCHNPAGYALSRKDLPGETRPDFSFTFTMFFSGGIIPLYLTIRNLGIYNSIWAMVLPLPFPPIT